MSLISSFGVLNHIVYLCICDIVSVKHSKEKQTAYQKNRVRKIYTHIHYVGMVVVPVVFVALL